MIPEKHILPLEDCTADKHLKRLDAGTKKSILDTKVFKCLDLTKAKISGGTEEANVEQLVGIEW